MAQETLIIGTIEFLKTEILVHKIDSVMTFPAPVDCAALVDLIPFGGDWMVIEKMDKHVVFSNHCKDTISGFGIDTSELCFEDMESTSFGLDGTALINYYVEQYCNAEFPVTYITGLDEYKVRAFLDAAKVSVLNNDPWRAMLDELNFQCLLQIQKGIKAAKAA